MAESNHTSNLYKFFPELEPLNPEAEHLLTPLIDVCSSYRELMLAVAAGKLERRLSFGTMIQLIYWAQIEAYKAQEEAEIVSNYPPR